MILTKRSFLFILTGLLATLAVVESLHPLQAQQQGGSSGNPVFVIPIRGMIDAGLVSLVRRSLTDAENQGAQAMILEIDTLGGRVDSALEIRDRIFDTRIKTIAYINHRAISAGALIALSCQSIVVAPGSSIGAATPILISPVGAETGSEKEISFVRAEFATTAERNHHNKLIAEAMVDPDVELYTRTTASGIEIIQGPPHADQRKPPGQTPQTELLIAKGKLLTLSGQEALKLKLAEYEAPRLGQVLDLYKLRDGPLVTAEINWSESLARFLTHPIVSGLLLTFGVLGIIYELKIPGWGVSGTVGVICLALFFGAHLLVGLAEWVEVLLFAVGIALLIAEIFFIPGFGAAGIIGIACILLSLYLSLVRSPVPRYSWEIQQFRLAMFTFFWFACGLLVLLVLTWNLLPRTPLYSRIVQTGEERAELGFTAEARHIESYLGKTGRTVTILRPAGRARFEGKLVDVISDGEYVPPNTLVRVIDVTGNRIVVVPEEAEKGHHA